MLSDLRGEPGIINIAVKCDITVVYSARTGPQHSIEGTQGHPAGKAGSRVVTTWVIYKSAAPHCCLITYKCCHGKCISSTRKMKLFLYVLKGKISYSVMPWYANMALGWGIPLALQCWEGCFFGKSFGLACSSGLTLTTALQFVSLPYSSHLPWEACNSLLEWFLSPRNQHPFLITPWFLAVLSLTKP